MNDGVPPECLEGIPLGKIDGTTQIIPPGSPLTPQLIWQLISHLASTSKTFWVNFKRVLTAVSHRNPLLNLEWISATNFLDYRHQSKTFDVSRRAAVNSQTFIYSAGQWNSNQKLSYFHYPSELHDSRSNGKYFYFL